MPVLDGAVGRCLAFQPPAAAALQRTGQRLRVLPGSCRPAPSPQAAHGSPTRAYRPAAAARQVTGPALTLAGFPPWCVRASEIYGVGPLAALTPRRLQAALRRYGATKQRFGK